VIHYGHQFITQEDISSVVEVLNSDFITQGPKIENFEKDIANFVNVKHVIAMNSATSALHVACLSLGLGDGDFLWTSTNTFVASSNSALMCGANVDFVDIDPKTFNMCLTSLEEKLIQAKIDGSLPKVLMVVHFGGLPVEMKKIKELSNRYNFKIIEDASHAVGASYMGGKVGNCEYSDITVFSFHPVKIITTAEGGCLLTNDDLICHNAKLLRSHGIERNNINKQKEEPWLYQQEKLGFNYRMTDLQAALGISQLKKISQFINKRQELLILYKERLKNYPISFQEHTPNCDSSNHLLPILFESNKTRLSVFQQMRKDQIMVNIHYIPVHTQPFYKKLGFKIGAFPKAEEYYKRTLSLPMHPGLKESDIDYIVGSLEKNF